MERMPTIKIVYVPHTLCSDTAQISNTLSAAEAKNAVIDYILKRLILKPTEYAGFFVSPFVHTGKY